MFDVNPSLETHINMPAVWVDTWGYTRHPRRACV
jgi:hypothetical protein